MLDNGEKKMKALFCYDAGSTYEVKLQLFVLRKSQNAHNVWNKIPLLHCALSSVFVLLCLDAELCIHFVLCCASHPAKVLQTNACLRAQTNHYLGSLLKYTNSKL